jgi:hypothetical protein
MEGSEKLPHHALSENSKSIMYPPQAEKSKNSVKFTLFPGCQHNWDTKNPDLMPTNQQYNPQPVGELPSRRLQTEGFYFKYVIKNVWQQLETNESNKTI